MMEAEEAEAEAAQAVVITVALAKAVVHYHLHLQRAVQLPSNAGGESEQGSWFPVSIKS